MKTKTSKLRSHLPPCALTDMKMRIKVCEYMEKRATDAMDFPTARAFAAFKSDFQRGVEYLTEAKHTALMFGLCLPRR